MHVGAFLQFCCILYSKLHTMKLSAVKIYGYLILRHDFGKLCLITPIDLSFRNIPIVCPNFEFLSCLCTVHSLLWPLLHLLAVGHRLLFCFSACLKLLKLEIADE